MEPIERKFYEREIHRHEDFIVRRKHDFESEVALHQKAIDECKWKLGADDAARQNSEASKSQELLEGCKIAPLPEGGLESTEPPFISGIYINPVERALQDEADQQASHAAVGTLTEVLRAGRKKS